LERLLRVIKPFGGLDTKIYFADDKTPIKVERDTIRKIIALSVP
jgi:hypothetical protein